MLHSLRRKCRYVELMARTFKSEYRGWENMEGDRQGHRGHNLRMSCLSLVHNTQRSTLLAQQRNRDGD